MELTKTERLFINRMVDEYIELSKKLDSLNTFIRNKKLDITSEDYILLTQQAYHMNHYKNILGKRLILTTTMEEKITLLTFSNNIIQQLFLADVNSEQLTKLGECDFVYTDDSEDVVFMKKILRGEDTTIKDINNVDDV